MTWLTTALLATAFYVGVVLTQKRLVDRGIPSEVVAFWFFLLTTIGLGALCFFKRSSLAIDRPASGLAILAALFAVGYNFYIVRAYAIAPNPGYATAILSSSAIATTLVAAFLFGSQLSIDKLLGMALILSGVWVISFGSRG